MDEIIKAIIESMTPHGPGWIIATVVVMSVLIIIYKRILPSLEKSRDRRDAVEEKKADAQIELEKLREQRKQIESESREQRDLERSQMEGRWLMAMEQSVNAQHDMTVAINGIQASMESMRASNDALKEQILESRDHSREMAVKVDEMNRLLKGE